MTFRRCLLCFLGNFLESRSTARYEVLDVNFSGGHGGNVAHFSQ